MSTAHDLEPFLKETNVQIRDALDTDLEGILQIYNDAVQNSTAIWNDHCVDLANRQAWLAERHAQGYPCWSQSTSWAAWPAMLLRPLAPA